MIDRPARPATTGTIWYRGWEIGWNEQAHFWAVAGWDAYKGGCDIDAPRVTMGNWDNCLGAIDDWEDENEQ